MSCNKTLDDDNYVAKLLTEDAKKSSLRYAQQGLSALLPRRPTGAAPKPNTRFLKAIVREADTHNAALKKKEELEARIRQRELRDRDRHGRTKHEDGGSLKRRHYGNGEGDMHNHRPQASRDRDCHNASWERHRGSEQQHQRSRRDRHLGGQLDVASGKDRRMGKSRSSSESRTGDGRNRNRTTDEGKANKGYCKRRRRRSRSRSSQSAASGEQVELKNASRDNINTIPPATIGHFHLEDARNNAHDAYDSDPLEVLVGPLEQLRGEYPPMQQSAMRSKGRGAHRPSGAAMDAHFSSDYNPAMDLHPNSEGDDEKEDWDMALEALRDREMFKQKQAERLREAGFADAEIKKWTESGKEKGVEDVKWTGKGEAREWDIGKADLR